MKKKFKKQTSQNQQLKTLHKKTKIKSALMNFKAKLNFVLSGHI